MTTNDLARLLRGFGHVVAASALEHLEAGEYVVLEAAPSVGSVDPVPVAWGTRHEQSEMRPGEKL